MPLAGGRFYRYKRYRYRRKRKYGKKRWYRKNRIASSRSRLSVRIPVSASYTFNFSANSHEAQNLMAVCPWCNTDSKTIGTNQGACMGVINSRLYYAYTNLFDEVKCDGFKVKMTVLGAVPVNNALSIGSATDRKTTYDEISNHVPTWTNLRDYAGFVEKQFASASVMKCSRSFWAADIIDRASFIDAQGMYTGVAPNRVYYEKAFDSASPPMFAPVCWIAPYLGAVLAAPGTVVIQVQTVFYMTFRSPRYGGGENSKAATSFSELDFTPDERETVAAVNGILDDEGRVDPERVAEEAEVLDEDTQPPTKKKPVVMAEYVDPKNGGGNSQLSDQEVAILRQLLAQEASSGESI